jgi:hypothetical protein
LNQDKSNLNHDATNIAPKVEIKEEINSSTNGTKSESIISINIYKGVNNMAELSSPMNGKEENVPNSMQTNDNSKSMEIDQKNTSSRYNSMCMN